MDNANKALIMAASTLVGIMLFALFTSFLRNLSIWPEAQDAMLTTEQKAAFNQEYEVYQKSLMYGVDVISCLNKAKSNNEKYENGEAFLSGSAYGVQYHIDVYVRLDDGNDATKSCLSESIRIYAVGRSLDAKKETERYAANSNPNHPDNKIEPVAGEDLKLKNLFKGPFANTTPEGYTSFEDDTLLSLGLTKDLTEEKYLVEGGGTHELDEDKILVEVEDEEIKRGYYSLENDAQNQLKNLLEYSGQNMKQTIKHTFPAGTDTEEKEKGLREWSTAVWETALYDFKTRKFACVAIDYNETTGLINEIWFSEI